MHIDILNSRVTQAQMDTLSCCAPVYIHFKAEQSQDIATFKQALLLFMADGRHTALRGEGTATAIISELNYEHASFEMALFGDHIPAIEDLKTFFAAGDPSPKITIDVRDVDDNPPLTDMYYMAHEFDCMDKLSYPPVSGNMFGKVLQQVETWFCTDAPIKPCSIMTLSEQWDNILKLNKISYAERFDRAKWKNPDVEIPALGLFEVLCHYLCCRVCETKRLPDGTTFVSVDSSESLEDYSRDRLLDAFVAIDTGLLAAKHDDVEWHTVFAVLVNCLKEEGNANEEGA